MVFRLKSESNLLQVRSKNRYSGAGTELRSRWWSRHGPSLAAQWQRWLFSFRSFPSEVLTFPKREECEMKSRQNYERKGNKERIWTSELWTRGRRGVHVIVLQLRPIEGFDFARRGWRTRLEGDADPLIVSQIVYPFFQPSSALIWTPFNPSYRRSRHLWSANSNAGARRKS